MWDLIVSVPDHCLSFYFKYQFKNLQNNSKVPHYYTVGNRYLSVLHARI